MENLNEFSFHLKETEHQCILTLKSNLPGDVIGFLLKRLIDKGFTKIVASQKDGELIFEKP